MEGKKTKLSKSGLTTATALADSSNYTHGRKGYKICKITPHHMAGVLTGKQCARIFQNPNRNASANYCIGNDGDIVCQGNIEQLEDSIKGKVWEVVRKNSDTMDDLDFGKVSNLKREGENTRIRIVSDRQPVVDASKVRAGLEDVFLYHCRGDME